MRTPKPPTARSVSATLTAHDFRRNPGWVRAQLDEMAAVQAGED